MRRPEQRKGVSNCTREMVGEKYTSPSRVLVVMGIVVSREHQMSQDEKVTCWQGEQDHLSRSLACWLHTGYTSEAREEKRKRRMDDRRRRREFRELTVTGKISRQKNEEIYKWGGRVDRRDAREGGKQKRAGFASGDDSGRSFFGCIPSITPSALLVKKSSQAPSFP